jgi:hypothetical protein
MSVICKAKWPNIKGDNSATMYSIYPSIPSIPFVPGLVHWLFRCLNPRPLNLINGVLTRLSDPTIQTLKYLLNSHPLVCFRWRRRRRRIAAWCATGGGTTDSANTDGWMRKQCMDRHCAASSPALRLFCMRGNLLQRHRNWAIWAPHTWR